MNTSQRGLQDKRRSNDLKEKPLGAKSMLFFFLAGISSLFIGLSIAYLFSSSYWSWSQFSFPKIFLISSVVLVVSSYFMHKSVQAIDYDETDEIRKNLGYTLIAGLLFLGLQIIGWWELTSTGIFFNGKPDGSYLYLLSGLHGLHILGGLLYMGYFYQKMRKVKQDPVQKLLFLSYNEDQDKLKSTAIYWHFVDILWIYLLLFFLIVHL